MDIKEGDCVRLKVRWAEKCKSLGLVAEVYHAPRNPEHVTGINATLVTGMQYLLNTEEFELLAQV